MKERIESNITFTLLGFQSRKLMIEEEEFEMLEREIQNIEEKEEE